MEGQGRESDEQETVQIEKTRREKSRGKIFKVDSLRLKIFFS